MGSLRGVTANLGAASRGPTGTWQTGFERVLRGCDLRFREKGGTAVGKTKRGKGTKLMAVADGAGVPIAVHAAPANPHEITLIEETVHQRFVQASPERLIGDRAYDSDPMDQRLAAQGIELIAPHRANRSRSPSQDGRTLRRYRRRWKVERLFAWLQNFRRLVIRYEHRLENYLGFVHLGCMMILLRRCF
jgi:transposase